MSAAPNSIPLATNVRELQSPTHVGTGLGLRYP